MPKPRDFIPRTLSARIILQTVSSITLLLIPTILAMVIGTRLVIREEVGREVDHALDGIAYRIDNTLLGIEQTSAIIQQDVPRYLDQPQELYELCRKVLEADPIKATMKVAKGDIEVALDLGANSAKGGGSTARAGASATASTAPAIATAGRRSTLLASRRPAGFAAEPMMGGASLRERRAAREQARQEEAAKEKELEDKRKAEAAEKEEKEKEREAQRQAEREEQRRELQLLKDELKAQREAVERAREEREAARRNENAEDES